MMEDLETHVKKMQGSHAISLREKLTNLLFKTTTENKIQIEEDINSNLSQIKISIKPAFVMSNTAQLIEDCNKLDSKLKNPVLMKRRSFLFFKKSKVTSETLAVEAGELLKELKAEFTI